jgi:hypothetical protein
MCLGVPMRVVSINDEVAVCEIDGVMTDRDVCRNEDLIEDREASKTPRDREVIGRTARPGAGPPALQ